MLGLDMLPSQAHKKSAGVVKEPDGLCVSQCFHNRGTGQEPEGLQMGAPDIQEPKEADSE